MRGGAALEPPGRRPVRVPRGGVPRGAWVHPRGAQGHRQRRGHVQDDPPHQGPAPPPHPHPPQPPREGAGELHRPRGPHRRQGRGVCLCQGVDAHLLRAARHAQGAQEGDPPRDREHLWVHCQGHRPAGRARGPAQQPQGPGAPEPRVHHGRHRHRRRDLRALHRAPRPAQRVPPPGAQRAERGAEGPLVPLRVYRGDGQGLCLRRRPPPGGRPDGPGPRAPPDGSHRGQAPHDRGLRAGLRGRPSAPDELCLAQHFRAVAPRHQRRHGGHRGHARVPRALAHPPAHAPGALPPRAQGARDLLEDLQHALHWRAGRAGGRVPSARGR
mmetsp:Transcript_11716/g.30350  ORF Transcript_11716/g.30350 Transcript_11716/m.30350 type:complete len:327 (+) Transcript_11716:1837-2817(+)